MPALPVTPHRPRRRLLTGLAGLALVVVPLSACSEENAGSEGGSIEYLAQVDDLSQNGGTTEVELDPAFVEALTTLGVTPSPFRDATIEGTTASFPITGGNVGLFEPGSTPDYVVGQVQHENSGLNLEAGGTTVTIGNFDVDPVASVVYGDVAVDGDVAVTSTRIFRLDGTTLQEPDLSGDDGQVVLQGSGVFLDEGAAQLLNETFGIDQLSGEVKVGVARIAVQTG